MKTKKLLIAGPDWGMEFGWKLMCWQGHIRRMSKDYDQTVVITSPQYYPLYEDFANYLPTIGTTDRFRYSDVDVDYVQPSKEICRSAQKQDFIKYKGKAVCYDVIIHARDDTRNVIGNRNWPEENWDKLCEKLRDSKKTIAFIGSLYRAYCPQEYADYRNVDLSQVFGLLSQANLCIGSSSGPMHLASLCGCPHIVWTDNQKWDLGYTKGTNRERYETVWNPFDTYAYVMSDGWQPTVEQVYRNVMEFFEK